MVRSKLEICGVAAVLAVVSLVATAVGSATTNEEGTPYDHLEWRNVGPVNMSGRVADVEGIPGNSKVLYVGAASGGVWKTVDGGLSFAPIFDDQPIASIGDLALAPSNPDVIYVGHSLSMYPANPSSPTPFDNTLVTLVGRYDNAVFPVILPAGAFQRLAGDSGYVRDGARAARPDAVGTGADLVRGRVLESRRKGSLSAGGITFRACIVSHRPFLPDRAQL